MDSFEKIQNRIAEKCLQELIKPVCNLVVYFDEVFGEMDAVDQSGFFMGNENSKFVKATYDPKKQELTAKILNDEKLLEDMIGKMTSEE